MNRPTATRLIHSIQARLKNEARGKGRPFAELLELFESIRRTFAHRATVIPPWMG